MPKKAQQVSVPKFTTEAEEARWWDRNSKMVEKELVAALKRGTAQRGTAQRLASETRKAG